MEKGTQYRTLLIQAIHSCATKFADVAERLVDKLGGKARLVLIFRGVERTGDGSQTMFFLPSCSPSFFPLVFMFPFCSSLFSRLVLLSVSFLSLFSLFPLFPSFPNLF